MNPHQQAWLKLAAAARRAPDERDVAAPYGFAVRVAAQAMTGQRPASSPMGYFALRALGVACLLALAAVATNYSAIRRLFDDRTPPSADPIAELVDIAS
jgi:hypothetical protein